MTVEEVRNCDTLVDGPLYGLAIGIVGLFAIYDENNVVPEMLPLAAAVGAGWGFLIDLLWCREAAGS